MATQVHQNFVASPIGNKLVTKLAGIGPEHGNRLIAQGYIFAKNIFGVYLKLGGEQFKEWLNIMCGATAAQALECYNCLNEWQERHQLDANAEPFNIEDGVQNIFGPVGQRIQNAGYENGRSLLPAFLLCHRDQHGFTAWLKGECMVSADQATACYDRLKEWSDANI